MSHPPRPPEDLPEGELFTEYIRLLEADTSPVTGYERAKLEERRARVLAEIGERLETLEALKALLGDTDTTTSRHSAAGSSTADSVDHAPPHDD